MTTFLFAFFGLLIIIIAMSVGVLMGRKPITGSCGGVGAALQEDGYICDICGNDPNKCDSQEAPAIEMPTTKAGGKDDLSYDATDNNR